MTQRKPTASTGSSDPLADFLADPENRRLKTADYVNEGVKHVTERHVDLLVARLDAVRERIAKINDSPRLRARLQTFADFLQETHHGPDGHAPARHEVAFALAYFFEASDRIPDGTPRYGLLDDAIVVEAVLVRTETALRAHAHRQNRTLPDPL